MENPKYLLGEEYWNILVEANEVYAKEKAECDSSLEKLDYYNEVMALQKDKVKDQETLRKDFERMQNEFKTDLKSILTEEELTKFMEMDFSTSAVRKRKKKRDNE